MGQRATFERRPKGLSREWAAVWDQALLAMKRQGSWAWEQYPVLNEYVFALEAAERARENDAPAEWHRHANRALSLANQLALTPLGKKAAGVGSGDKQPEDPFRALDELAVRRAGAPGRRSGKP